MIEIFQGRIGGGKTYSAVLRMAAHLSKGGHVFTNIEVNPLGFSELCRKKFGVVINFDLQFHAIEGEEISRFDKLITSGSMDCPVLCVIDEAHLWFNAREWQKSSKELMTFVTQSRKVMVDIILITQSMSTLDKHLRIQSQFIWAFKDFQKFISWFPIPSILCLQFDVDGTTFIGWHFVIKSPLVYSAYNTNALLRKIDFGQVSLSPVEIVKAGRRVAATPDQRRRRAVWIRRHAEFVGASVFGCGLVVFGWFCVSVGRLFL